MAKVDSNIIDFGKDEKLNKLKYKETDLVPFEAKNPRQKKFTQYFFDNKTPLILLNGYAGVGKTFIALHAALTQVLDQSTHYEKIVIVRSAVESGMSQGFLPGSLCEKNEPYELPYKLLLKKMFKEPNDLHYANLKTLGCIDFLSTTYLRGITLDNTIIIVEEAQNLDYTELKTIVTRAGVGSRVVLTGDVAQDDLARKKKVSGMGAFMRVVENMDHSYFKTVEFLLEDVVRSGLCSAFLISEYELNKDNQEEE